MTSWSPILPETVWSKVAPVLRRELGEGPYNSYVAPSIVRPGLRGDPVLVTPTAYARDWFTKNALRRTQELWTQYDPQARVLDLKARIDFEHDMNVAASVDTIETPGTVLSAPVMTAVAAAVAINTNRVIGLQERLTFDSFVSGRGNEFAYTMSRQVAMWLCKQHTTRSYPDIGRRFGGRDHTTVLHAVKKIEELLTSDDQIARDVEALTRKLRNT